MNMAPVNGAKIPPRPVFYLWIAFLAPLLAWFAQLNIYFFLAAYACAHGRIWLLHLGALAAFGIAAAGIGYGWLSMRYFPQQRIGLRFLAILAMILGGFYLLGIFANMLPNLMLEPCL